ncbi:MAG: hypothetical protein BM557_09535 [Flavobacterium sp. MedPE-SWcel]|uniref:hypothetical protein n=1 Tax=uncultured Flavobacterium sp. TaxID=165435 RepID=UPI00091DA8D8|nr:hypothetical protein [uncultured Flavobacterium sp.]OIQ16546.1 MAG: hypothetical protein BM557_09535 [Flavobacterium sp. MedPE-SWcel]
MENILKITIDNKEYTLKFSFSFLRKLGDMWGCKGPVEVQKKFSENTALFVQQTQNIDPDNIPDDATIDVPFRFVEMFTDVMQAAAATNDKEQCLDVDEAAAWMFNNLPEVQKIITLFVQAMPVVKETPPDAGKKIAATT